MVNITANNDKYAVKSVNIYTHSHISYDDFSVACFNQFK